MSATISLRGQPQELSAASASRKGAYLNLSNFGIGGTAISGSRGKQQALRAVAAAVAMAKPGEALKFAIMADKNPDQLLSNTVNEDKLSELLNPVRALQSDRSGAPGADNEETAVARAIGADPVLVKAAHDVAANDAANDPAKFEICKAGIIWVAWIDGKLLERAARAAARVTQLGQIKDTASRLETIEQDVSGLSIKADGLRTDVDTLRTDVDQLITKVGGIP